MPVRPKSREETPKEGSKTIARLAREKVDVQRTKRNRNFSHCSNMLTAYLRQSNARDAHMFLNATRHGAAVGDKFESFEEVGHAAEKKGPLAVRTAQV